MPAFAWRGGGQALKEMVGKGPPRDRLPGLTSGIPSWWQAARKLCRFLRLLAAFSFGCGKRERGVSVDKGGEEAQPAGHAQAAVAQAEALFSCSGAQAACCQPRLPCGRSETRSAPQPLPKRGLPQQARARG